jgi:peptide-methionine (S)-S-oxide reductase
MTENTARPSQITAIFAAGCFWGVEETLARLPGVIATRVGYTGGHTENPAYQQVCAGQTGHAEAVEVTFNPAMIGYADLLEAFWGLHDPTTRNQQGPDVGTQYRSVIFWCDYSQRIVAEASRAAAQSRFSRPIVTDITPAETFWPAEAYHQQYYQKHDGGCSA